MAWKDHNAHEFTGYVHEYIYRKRLAGIGCTSSYDSMPWLKAEIFVQIDSVLDEINAEETKKARKKG